MPQIKREKGEAALCRGEGRASGGRRRAGEERDDKGWGRGIEGPGIEEQGIEGAGG